MVTFFTDNHITKKRATIKTVLKTGTRTTPSLRRVYKGHPNSAEGKGCRRAPNN